MRILYIDIGSCFSYLQVPGAYPRLLLKTLVWRARSRAKNRPLCGRMTIRFTKPPSRPILTIVQAVRIRDESVKAMAQKAYSLAHTKWMCKRHIVFTPKYRRKVIYNQIRKDIGEILRKLCEYKGVEIIEGHLMPDHVRMLVAIPPKYSVASVMGYLKGKGSLMIFDRHASLKHEFGNRKFWAEATACRPSG